MALPAAPKHPNPPQHNPDALVLALCIFHQNYPCTATAAIWPTNLVTNVLREVGLSDVAILERHDPIKKEALRTFALVKSIRIPFLDTFYQVVDAVGHSAPQISQQRLETDAKTHTATMLPSHIPLLWVAHAGNQDLASGTSNTSGVQFLNAQASKDLKPLSRCPLVLDDGQLVQVVNSAL